jgi:hypothetical protein
MTVWISVRVRRFMLVRGLQILKNGFFCHRCGTGGVRLKYGG